MRRTESGCWLWIGKRSDRGYGLIGVNGRCRGAHVVGYELLVGPVPPGLELDHLCRTHGCVNPAHLEPVTHLENVRRGTAGKKQREKTRCKNGHAFTPENTIRETRDGRRRRSCRRCRNAAVRRYEERNKESENERRRAYYQRKRADIRIR